MEAPHRHLPLAARLRYRWSCPSGYRDVLRIALPLVLSTGSMTIQQFVDRLFLTWHSPDELAASMPAGILSFTVVAFFMGTASYAATFVAQYTGAGRHERVGPSVWQAIYFSLFSSIFLIGQIPVMEEIGRAHV